MAIPEFLRELRELVGHRLMLLPGASAVVLDDRQRVLLVRRADNGRWTVVGGITEPGEDPAATAVRETYEETAVAVVPERVVSIETEEPVVYPHGDVAQYLTITFRCRAVGGEARVNDDESIEVGWFALDELPPMDTRCLTRIERALQDGPTWFAPPRQAAGLPDPAPAPAAAAGTPAQRAGAAAPSVRPSA